MKQQLTGVMVAAFPRGSWLVAQPSLGGKYILGFKLLAQCKAPSSADTSVSLEIPAIVAEVV